MNDKVTVSVDDILDGTLDDLADIPEWKPFPAGGHRVIMSFEKTAPPAKAGVKIKMVAVETLELANATDVPLEKGAENTVVCGFDNDFGQGLFKKVMAAFKEHLGMPDGTKNSEIMAAAQNMEVIVVTTVRPGKEKGQFFTRIEDIAFE